MEQRFLYGYYEEPAVVGVIWALHEAPTIKALLWFVMCDFFGLRWLHRGLRFFWSFLYVFVGAIRESPFIVHRLYDEPIEVESENPPGERFVYV